MTEYLNKIICGDCLSVMKGMPDGFANCIVTSPPYWGLRDYGVEGQLGLEKTPEEYTAKMVEIFHEARRVLRDDGTLWLNLGDTYAGNRSYQVPDNKHTDVGNGRGMTVSRRRDDAEIPRTGLTVLGLKQKDLIGIPWRIAFALQSNGWYLRSDIIWHKPNPMPESVTDRPTKAHEYIFLMSKREKYYYDAGAIKEPDHNKPSGNGFVRSHRLTYGDRGNEEQWMPGGGRNKRSVWSIATHPFSEAHFATFPPELIKPCILAGCPENGIVLDPFFGAGTTGVVCTDLGRNYIGIELNPEYVAMAEERISRATAQMRMFV